MGSGEIPILTCDECMHEINKESDLVSGSKDINDKRCPECGSSQFICGLCNNYATKLHVTPNLTWSCLEGCNP